MLEKRVQVLMEHVNHVIKVVIVTLLWVPRTVPFVLQVGLLISVVLNVYNAKVANMVLSLVISVKIVKKECIEVSVKKMLLNASVVLLVTMQTKRNNVFVSDAMLGNILTQLVCVFVKFVPMDFFKVPNVKNCAQIKTLVRLKDLKSIN